MDVDDEEENEIEYDHMSEEEEDLMNVRQEFLRYINLGQPWDVAVLQFDRDCLRIFHKNNHLGILLNLLQEGQDLSDYEVTFSDLDDELIYTFESEEFTMMYIYSVAQQSLELRAFDNNSPSSQVSLNLSI